MHVPDWQYGRRRLLQTGVALSAAVLAGCTGGPSDEGDASGDGAEPTGGDTEEGSFRLLISDQPADIGDFARLDVTFVEVRLFPSGDDDNPSEDGEVPDNESDTDTDGIEDSRNESPDTSMNASSVFATAEDHENTTGNQSDEDPAVGDGETGDEKEETEDEDRPGDEAGHVSIVLPGDETSTVDLTEVVGERAIPIFEGAIPAGSYTKLELAVGEVDATLDGTDADASVDVKVPSGRLQITSPFTVDAEGGVDFVFDINVVKRGRSGSYNLLPVIGESGVAGRDVAIEEVERGRGRRGDEAPPENASTDHPGNGPPDAGSDEGNNQD